MSEVFLWIREREREGGGGERELYAREKRRGDASPRAVARETKGVLKALCQPRVRVNNLFIFNGGGAVLMYNNKLLYLITIF